ncbi:MAG: caspase family protein [Chitinophagaceae bacterium]|nr:caspase family protein [Chitinophagaceae bacterium]
MRPLLLLLFSGFVICFSVSNPLHAQNFFYCKFEITGSAPKTYEAFITVQEDTTAHEVRVQPFIPGQSEKPRFEGTLFDSAFSDNGFEKLLFMPEDSLIEITGLPDAEPSFMSKFEFSESPEGTFSSHYLSKVYCLVENNWVEAKLLEAKTFNLFDIDLGLVRTFYFSGSRYFKTLVENMQEESIATRSLSSQELKTRIWMIIAVDTLDPSVGKASKQDMLNMTEMFKNIAADMDLPDPKIRYIMGKNFNKKALTQALTQFLKPDPDDIVIFYFSGHGYRLPIDKNDYPRMIVSNKWTEATLYDESFAVADIRKILENKREKARLTFIINDCCNTIFPLPRVKGRSYMGTRSLGSVVATHNFIKLFMEPKGIIQLGSSSIGEKSVGNPTIGGYYTSEWLFYLNQSLSRFGKGVSWENICRRAGTQASKKVYAWTRCDEGTPPVKVRCKQTPTFTLDIKIPD